MGGNGNVENHSRTSLVCTCRRTLTWVTGLLVYVYVISGPIAAGDCTLIWPLISRSLQHQARHCVAVHLHQMLTTQPRYRIVISPRAIISARLLLLPLLLQFLVLNQPSTRRRDNRFFRRRRVACRLVKDDKWTLVRRLARSVRQRINAASASYRADARWCIGLGAICQRGEHQRLRRDQSRPVWCDNVTSQSPTRGLYRVLYQLQNEPMVATKQIRKNEKLNSGHNTENTVTYSPT